MPPSVPSGVTRAFEALTPAFFTFTVGAIVQIIIIFVSCLIYLPFMEAQDNILLKEEQEELNSK